jgi:hypothetical protein
MQCDLTIEDIVHFCARIMTFICSMQSLNFEQDVCVCARVRVMRLQYEYVAKRPTLELEFSF